MIDKEKFDRHRFSLVDSAVEFLTCLDRIERSADGAVLLASLSSDLGFLDRGDRWMVLREMLRQVENHPELAAWAHISAATCPSATAGL